MLNRISSLMLGAALLLGGTASGLAAADVPVEQPVAPAFGTSRVELAQRDERSEVRGEWVHHHPAYANARGPVLVQVVAADGRVLEEHLGEYAPRRLLDHSRNRHRLTFRQTLDAVPPAGSRVRVSYTAPR